MSVRVSRTGRRLASACLCAVAAASCRAGFQVKDYPSPVDLYTVGMEQYNLGKWKNAVTALDQAVLLLGPRDTLLPRAHFYLAKAHANRGHYLLASKSYDDVFRSFGEDSLADDALLGMAEAEARLWRRPDLDPEHGRKAGEAYVTFQRLFPTSSLLQKAKDGEHQVAEWFAKKDFDVGMGLVRRRAYDSALIYFKDVFSGFPGTKGARDSGLKMVEIYRRLKYTEDASETCRQLATTYASDAAVKVMCPGVAVDTAK